MSGNKQTQDDGWITTGQTTSWNEEDTLTGTYERVKTGVGTHNSNVYVLRKEDGSEIGVWGSTVINGRFEEISVGSLVRIEALGETVSKTGAKYKDYRIQYKPAKIEDPFVQLSPSDDFPQE